MVDVKLSLECVLRPHLNALTSYVSDIQIYRLSCTWVIKGIKLWCPRPTLKIMCLPKSLLGTKVRALNNALIAKNKKKMDSLPSQRYGSAAANPQRLNPLWLTQKNSLQIFVRRKKDERELSPNGLSNIYIVLPLEICQNSGKWAQASSLQKKQIPLVQV